MANKLKTEVRINDLDWDSTVDLVLNSAEAVSVLEAVVRGELKVNLLTGNGKVKDNPAAYAQ